MFYVIIYGVGYDEVKIIKDLEEKIKLSMSRIEFARKQLIGHESGELKLSLMVVASTELTIEKNRFLLNKYRSKLQKIESLESGDLDELEEVEIKKEEIRQKNYFKYQAQRLRHTKNRTVEEISAAVSILNEMPEDIQLDDYEIFQIGHTSSSLYLDMHSDLDEELIEIKSEFMSLVEKNFNEKNNELKLLNYRIPILILQLRILIKNIKENIDETNLENHEFKGLPKFEDWWIHELWISHQAYMGLFKWKKIILNLCITSEQKRAFETIFKNWILVKKILNSKNGSAYFYNYAFDEMIAKYAELEDEYDEKNLHSMEKIVETLTKNEDFTTVSHDHLLKTPYMMFKLEKLSNKDTNKDD